MFNWTEDSEVLHETTTLNVNHLSWKSAVLQRNDEENKAYSEKESMPFPPGFKLFQWCGTWRVKSAFSSLKKARVIRWGEEFERTFDLTVLNRSGGALTYDY